MRQVEESSRTCVGIIDYQGRDTLGGDDTGGVWINNENGADVALHMAKVKCAGGQTKT